MHLPAAQRSEATLRRVALGLSVPNNMDLREHFRPRLLRILDCIEDPVQPALLLLLLQLALLSLSLILRLSA